MRVSITGFNPERDPITWLPYLYANNPICVEVINLLIKAYLAKYGPCLKLEITVENPERDWSKWEG